METDLIITVESKPSLFSLALAFIGGVVAGVFVYRRWDKPRRKDERKAAEDYRDYSMTNLIKPKLNASGHFKSYDTPCELNDAITSRFCREIARISKKE